MTVPTGLRPVPAAALALLLVGCNVPYQTSGQTSGKVAVAERSWHRGGWHRGGVQHVVARRYAATLRFSETTSLLTEYVGGYLTMDGMTFPPGCHSFGVRAGDTLRLDVSGLRMSVPAQACEQTGRP